MSQLSAQTIERLCQGDNPMIVPFYPEKIVVNGKSHGLSSASYDCCIDHDLTLGVAPGYVFKEWMREQSFKTLRGIWAAVCGLDDLRNRLLDEPPAFSLAFTVEDFHLPADVAGAVCDKSTYARCFISAFNTFFDPGFNGNATLELVNVSDQRLTYKKGDPVCQFLFTHLDEATVNPYNGKYQHQTKAAHGPRHEQSPPRARED